MFLRLFSVSYIASLRLATELLFLLFLSFAQPTKNNEKGGEKRTQETTEGSSSHPSVFTSLADLTDETKHRTSHASDERKFMNGNCLPAC
jgi:hypothetical protein